MAWRNGARRLARLTLAVMLAGVAASLSGCFASPPQIISLTPSRGSIGVPADTPIAVQFDRPVVRESVAARFTVNPPIPGCRLSDAFSAGSEAPCAVVWSGGNAVFTLLHPRAVLAPDTQYTFTLRNGFREPSGAVNTVDHTWTITSAGAPQVRAVSPSDGSSAVPVDGPITVDFNSGMDVSTTQTAISLDPAVPGTQVVRNEKDKSRFLLVPGQLLLPHVTYRLSVATSATDLHGQRLLERFSASFTTGAVSPGPHGVVLARRGDQPPTEVLLTALAPVEDGMPVAAQTVLSAPVCSETRGCGAAADDAPVYTFAAAALSADNSWLAVVEQDRTAPGAPATLLVLAAASGAFQAVFPGATLPSWSPDGSRLAYYQGDAVHLFTPATKTGSVLPPGDTLVAPPVWSPAGELLALDEMSPAGEHIVLADAVADARFSVPGLSGEATAPA
ncbi:MAG: Ig-like domain-containing protein, partial [Candidatus Dormibacteria bacterium]